MDSESNDLECDHEPFQGPKPTAEWLAGHQRKLVSEENERVNESAKDETMAMLERMVARVAAEEARFRTLPCQGQIEHLAGCTSDVEGKCPDRTDVMCPRNQLVKVREDGARAHAQQRDRLVSAGLEESLIADAFDREPIETSPLRSLRDAFGHLPPPVFVVLAGGVGVGKSCAAAWWATQHGARWIGAPALARLATWDAQVEQLGRVQRLVIDDLGAEHLHEKSGFIALFDEVINARYAGLRQTVITTNMTAEDFRGRYGARVVDRIRERGQFVTVGGASLRKRPARGNDS